MPRLQPGGGTLVGTLMFDRGDTGPFQTYLAHASHGPGGESLVKVSNTIDMAWRGDQGIGDVPSGFPTAGPPMPMPGPQPGGPMPMPGPMPPGFNGPRRPFGPRGPMPGPPPASRGARGGPEKACGERAGGGPRGLAPIVRDRCLSRSLGLGARACVDVRAEGDRHLRAAEPVPSRRRRLLTRILNGPVGRCADPTETISRPGQPVDLAVEGEDVELARGVLAEGGDVQLGFGLPMSISSPTATALPSLPRGGPRSGRCRSRRRRRRRPARAGPCRGRRSRR